MVPWPLITLLAGPERTATIQGFWKAPLPGEAVTDSPRSTLVVPNLAALSKQWQPVYTGSPLPFYPVGDKSGQLNPDMVGEAVWAVASIKLVFCSTGWLPTGVDQGDSGGSILPKLVGLIWGHWLVAPRLTLPKPWMMSCLVNITCSFTLSLKSMTLLAEGWKSGSSGRLSFSTQYCNPQA